MSTPVRVAGFVAALVAVFGLALGLGAAVGPDSEPAVAAGHGSDAGHGDEPGHADDADEVSADEKYAAEPPGGLMVSQDGYTLALERATLPAGDDVPLRFAITGPDGAPVTSYEVEHEKQLHLIVVRRDFSGFQHVHPTLGEDGVWSVPLDLTSGPWRVFADFTATGAEPMTLGADVAVRGRYAPSYGPREVRTAEVDGYTVTLEGELTGWTESRLTLTVEKDGRPVTDLQPYLGAYGHLVALRDGDLAYLHVHPDGEPGDGSTRPGPEVVFHAEVPSDGDYRLFLDFQHRGVVRTAAFTVPTEES
jgi:hypothetical protein